MAITRAQAARKARKAERKAKRKEGCTSAGRALANCRWRKHNKRKRRNP